MSRYFKLNGIVEANVTVDEFLDKFIDFIEENGWSYGGGTEEVNEEAE